MSNNNKVYQPKKNQGFIPPIKATKKKKADKFLFIVLIVCFIFWSVGSALGIYNFCKDNKDNNSLVAYAEEPVTFDGYLDNYSFQSYAWIFNNWDNLSISSSPVNFAFDLKVVNSRLFITSQYCVTYIPYVTNYQAGSFYTILDTSGNFIRSQTIDINIANGLSYYELPVYFNFFYSNNKYNMTGVLLYLECSVGFNGNVSMIELNHDLNFQGVPEKVTNYIKYIDNNNNYLRIDFEVRTPVGTEIGTINNSSWYWKQRTMILTSTLGSDNNYNLGYNDGYNEGSFNGFEDGYQDGYNDGSAVGTENGYNNGFQKGYDAGVISAGNYTFLNLLTSVVDAPIQVIRSMLNFDILGFNMTNFFFSIVTICIIIFVVRLFF